MGSWTDLKRRVGPYRRCYVYTHSCLPREPVVILHVALMNHIANSIQVFIYTMYTCIMYEVLHLECL